MEVTDSVEATKKNYESLLKRFAAHKEFIFSALPTFKQVIDEIESNEDQDGKDLYQGTEVKRSIQEWNYIRNHAEEVVQGNMQLLGREIWHHI